jgi:hypothetical protein
MGSRFLSVAFFMSSLCLVVVSLLIVEFILKLSRVLHSLGFKPSFSSSMLIIGSAKILLISLLGVIVAGFLRSALLYFMVM